MAAALSQSWSIRHEKPRLQHKKRDNETATLSYPACDPEPYRGQSTLGCRLKAAPVWLLHYIFILNSMLRK